MGARWSGRFSVGALDFVSDVIREAIFGIKTVFLRL